MKQGAVFDCMVFLQGATKPNGPATACLALVESNYVELFISQESMDEVRDVLTRPKIQRKFPGLTPLLVDSFLDRITRNATIISDVPRAFAFDRDPKDEKYLNLAIAASVPYLVSRDNDLLDLMDRQTTQGMMFRNSYPFLSILDPVAFLREFRAILESS